MYIEYKDNYVMDKITGYKVTLWKYSSIKKANQALIELIFNVCSFCCHRNCYDCYEDNN